MSAPSPGQLRPNSAIYIGAAALDSEPGGGPLLSTPPTPSEILLSPGGTSIIGRIPHLPSPPHTSSTSGSAGEIEKEAAAVVGSPARGSSKRTISPPVVIMQNGQQKGDVFDEHSRNYNQQYQDQERDDITARIPSPLAERNKQIHEKLDRFNSLGHGRLPGSPSPRTISLGRASSASAAIAAAATNSMRHTSMVLPPRESREKDVFDRDDSNISSSGRSHSASNSISNPQSYSTNSNSNSDMDDRSTTPPATPAKRPLDLAQTAHSNSSSPHRQRLLSEPTSPRRLQMLRDRTPGRPTDGAVNLSSPLSNNAVLSSPLNRGSPLGNTLGRSSTVNSPGGSSLRRMTTLNRSELGTVEEDRDRRSPATRKARTPIPFEFLATADTELHPPDATGDRSRQPSPGLYASEGVPSSPGLYISESNDPGTRASGSGTASRRPRPPGIRSSIDRWEREQMGDAGLPQPPPQQQQQTESGPETSSIRRASSAVGTGVRSVVNESLRAAGLTRARKVSDNGAVVASPTVMQARERMDSFDMLRSGSGSGAGETRLSAERDRSRSRMSVDGREREPLDMDSLRERATRNAFFSPNVRGTRTIHNVLNPNASGAENSSSPGEDPSISGRETPANLRLFKANYNVTLNNSTPTLKTYTSPSGTQRHLPSRSVTVLNMSSAHGNESQHSLSNPRSSVPGTPSPMKRPVPLESTSNQSSPSTVNGPGPVNLLQDALWMFESHIHKLPPNIVPEITNDVLRDAKGIVNSVVALNGALRGAAAVCVDEQIEAETDGKSDAALGAADVWRRVGAEFREDARAADELVRALTSFMIGAGRMLRVSSSSASHNTSGSGGGHTRDGSVSRAGGSSLVRGGTISRAGGSSDGRRSVEGWSLGIGMSGAERRSMDGRRSVEPGAYPGGSRRSADEYREETMRRLTGRQQPSQRDLGEAGSNGSGGSRDRPTTGTGASHRVSFQAYGNGGDSRSATSLSMRRDLPRISHEDVPGSPGLRTFTSLSSRRSTGHPTPATNNHKALPRLPVPQSAGSAELTFPQSEDGGDRTPIELTRPHMRHSTMPALAVPPPLPTLPSERLVDRSKSIGKHAASNSITSASTSSTTRPKLPNSSPTVRRSEIMPATGDSSVATTALTPTTARPREMISNAGGSSPLASSFTIGRAKGSAAVNGLQQVAIGNPPRKRTISNADDDYSEEDPRTARLPPANSSSNLSSMAKSSSGSGSGAGLGFPSSGSRDTHSDSPTTGFEPRRSGVRPLINRRTSSTLSGASNITVTSSIMNASTTTPARPRAVTRMSSAGTLSNPIYNGSRSSLATASSGGGGNSTESGADEERKLRRSRVRLSLNAMMEKRGGIGDLLAGRRPVSGRPMLEGDEADVGESPSLSTRERRERRRLADGVLP